MLGLRKKSEVITFEVWQHLQPFPPISKKICKHETKFKVFNIISLCCIFQLWSYSLRHHSFLAGTVYYSIYVICSSFCNVYIIPQHCKKRFGTIKVQVTLCNQLTLCTDDIMVCGVFLFAIDWGLNTWRWLNYLSRTHYKQIKEVLGNSTNPS